MDNFEFQNTTKICFGKDAVSSLGAEVKKLASKVLIVYGGGSIKKNGAYDDSMKSLHDSGIEVLELSGVEPNPHISTVRKGADICKKNKIEAVIAIGGGSVIDCAKILSAGALYNGDPWDFLIRKSSITASLPLFVVLTLAATGSEMNSGAVITNEVTHEKYGVGGPTLLPRVSFENPCYTFSVNKWQTAAGASDILSHIMEQYFGDVKGSYVQDRMAEALMKTVIHFAPIALNNPDDYEARGQIMWSSTLALNNLLCAGHDFPWEVHPLEHPLSGYFDITHGAGLAILTPNYYRYILNEKNVNKFKEFAINVFDVNKDGKNDMEIAKEGIERLASFFSSLGIPSHLKDLGVDSSKFVDCAKQCLGGDKYLGDFARLDIDDIVNIYKMSY